MKKITDFEKKMDLMLTESMNKTSLKESDEDTLMIKIGGEKGKFWPWYFKKMGDSTHFYMANNEKALSTGAAMAHHVGQHRGEHYYEPLRKWLKGGITTKQLYGKKFG
jgi:hypothetical protein